MNVNSRNTIAPKSYLPIEEADFQFRIQNLMKEGKYEGVREDIIQKLRENPISSIHWDQLLKDIKGIIRQLHESEPFDKINWEIAHDILVETVQALKDEKRSSFLESEYIHLCALPELLPPHE